MSRLSDLVEEPFSHGVEYKSLREVADFRRGESLTAKSARPGEVPVVANGPSVNYFHNVANRTGEIVVIARSGAYAGLVSFWNQPLFLSDAFSLHAHPDSMLPRFLFYVLQGKQRDFHAMKKGAGVPHVRVREVEEWRTPVPPMDVQGEIVSILDTFSALEAELEAELEARRRQYEYYRDSLLSFREAGGVRWLRMGEVGRFVRGRRFVKDDIVADGLPAIHYGEIYTHYGTSTTAALSHVRRDMQTNLRFAQPGDVVIAGVGETVEDVGKAVAWLGDGQVAVHDDCFAFSHAENPKFIAYCLQTTALNADKEKYVSRAKVKRLSAEGLGKLLIPVPPRDEQDRLVELLDKFDALVNDLSIGLPAELSYRRKQYEYYRDRLLSFGESAA